MRERAEVLSWLRENLPWRHVVKYRSDERIVRSGYEPSYGTVYFVSESDRLMFHMLFRERD